MRPQEGRGWSSLLIRGHSQNRVTMVLIPLPDTKGQVKAKGNSLSQPEGFQDSQIRISKCGLSLLCPGHKGKAREVDKEEN